MKTAAFLLILLTGAWSAEGRLEIGVPLDSDAGAKIVVTSCFDNLALAGYAPVDVTINNSSGQTREWTFNFASPGYTFGSANSVKSTFTLSAENNGTRTAKLLVPTLLTTNGGLPLQMTVTGYGANGNEQMLGGRSSGYSGKTATQFVAISESLGTSIWSSLEAKVGSGEDLTGSTVSPDDLPEDWRGLSGVGGMWLSGDELNHLSPAQRLAVATWVHTGGWLMLCGVAQAPEDFKYAGFGQVRTLPAKLDLQQTAEIIDELPARGTTFQTGTDPRYNSLAEVKPNVLLLGGFIGIFAIIVGPVSVFGLARRRRERLFWTTPLISLCASGLLMGMIVAKDGTGGHGFRTAVVCLFPESRTAVVRQEQISRTGVLTGSAFQTRDPVYMQELGVVTPDSAWVDPEATGRELGNDGTSFGKEWFETRAVQAQRIVAVTPTRAEITLLNGADVRDKGAAPVIVSSFATTLDTFYYHDEHQKEWQGKDVRTGEKQTLQASTDPAQITRLTVGGDFDLQYYTAKVGYFWATASGGEDYVTTLGSIRWTDEPVTYVGPVSE
jgi:hypothetical protein